MRIKKKLALLLASALLVTSINVMPVEASTSNQETGSENDNAVASMDLTLSIAALNSNQGNTVKNATGNTVLSLAVEELGENQGNTVKNATGSTNLTLQVEALNDNQGNTGKNATGSTTLTLVIGDQKKEVAKPEQGTAEYTYTGSPITFLLKNTQDQADYEVTGIEQTDVGTYTVTVALKDKTNCVWAGGTTDDISYQYQILPKELTAAMVTATVSYTYNGTTITPAVRVSDKDKELVKDTDYTLGGDISGTAVKSDYRMTVTGKGNYKGTVDVSWEITETPSDNTENILAEAKEIVTSKINGKEFTVSNLTTDKDIENAIRTALLKEDKTKKVVSEITVTKKAAEIEKAGKIAIAVKLSLNGKDITFDLNKEIPALVGKNITVTVKDEDDKAISGAEVKVMLGEIKKAENNSVADGKCTFSNLPAGLYNIVITKDRVTKTAIADLTTADAAVAVELDTTSKGSSHLTVKGEENTGTGEEADKKPKAATKVAETVVENLDVFTKALLDKEESEAVSDVESYRVDMYVEAKADTQISKSTQNEMVKEANKGETAAADKATNIDFLDISIIKTITKNSGKKESEQIADTGETVIEIIIPFNFTGKTNVKVLREHNGVVRKFDEIDNTATGADGTYKIDVTKGLIILYAKYFSTYAVSYVAEGESAIVEPVAPTYPFYPGGGSVSVTVPATGITIEADKYEITKEGETVAIKAAIQPSNATDTKLTFTSSDEKVAKVDANGVITAVGNGTATITIKTANDITKTITITVNIPSEENKDDGNKDDGNTEDSSSTEEEAVTPAKVAANTIAINKGLKVSQTGSKINVSWGKVAGADGYLVYAAYCGTDFGNAVKTIKDPSSVSTTITKINGKKLDLKKNFKVYVKAYKLVDGKKVAFGTSITAHITGTKNAKNTNVKELKLTSKSKLALVVGKTSKIKAKVVLVDPAKKQLSDSHTKEFRYASSNKKVASVDKNGKITAKAKGTCYIYVYARNGYAKKVTVTVK